MLSLGQGRSQWVGLHLKVPDPTIIHLSWNQRAGNQMKRSSYQFHHRLPRVVSPFWLIRSGSAILTNASQSKFLLQAHTQVFSVTITCVAWVCECARPSPISYIVGHKMHKHAQHGNRPLTMYMYNFIHMYTYIMCKVSNIICTMVVTF